MMVSIVLVRGILAELKSHRIDTSSVLEGLSLTEDALSDVRGRLPIADFEVLVERAIALRADPGFGLTLARNAPANMLQILGLMLLSSRTLRDAFALLTRYSELTADGISYTLAEHGQQATFTFHCPIGVDTTSRFAADFTLVTVLRVCQHFFGGVADGPLRVLFEHEAPTYRDRYEPLFGCPVAFGQRSNALVFPQAILDQVQFHADSTVNAALCQMGDQVLSELSRPRSLSDRIRVLLQANGALASVDPSRLARGVGLTRRALRRRLAAEGTSLSDLVDEARCKVACEELRRSGSIETVAERVGYSERSAFHRAFKRWTGQTPIEYARGNHAPNVAVPTITAA
ncbi:MAG TPA: AraC family transcriptional regulator [Polyangiales bacterium]|nr:AraC family transcriptional regulator [Polyangiales bacterium]